MNPREFLNVADTWAMGDGEAEWRSGASRAYYAAFHVARDLLSALGFAVPRADQAHAYLWQRLNNCGHPDVQEAGDFLDKTRSRRNGADYDLHRPFPQRAAVEQVEFALRVIQLLDAVATAPTVRTVITEAMKLYERDVLRVVTWRP
jgi:uncharacterized protein (UPF0332 family)